MFTSAPVAMTSTMSDTPTALDNLEAVHVALRKPVMANIATNELAPPMVLGCACVFFGFVEQFQEECQIALEILDLT